MRKPQGDENERAPMRREINRTPFEVTRDLMNYDEIMQDSLDCEDARDFILRLQALARSQGFKESTNKQKGQQ